MAAVTTASPQAPTAPRLTESRGFLGFWFMLPAAVLLLLFLTYPLGLGVWLGFTDARIGRPGIFIGLENYQYLWDDSVFWLAVFNTLLYTTVASVLKFVLGLWLALLLNENLPLKSFFRAIVLLPWVVPTVLSAIAFWWIYDAQFSIISWGLMELGIIDNRINFLGDPTNARASVIAANVWRGIPFVAITLLAGLQTIPKDLSEAALVDGASSMQVFFRIIIPLMRPVILFCAVTSTIGSFNLFAEVASLTGGGPANATITPLIRIFNVAFRSLQFGYASAMAYTFFAFIFLLTLVQMRTFGRE